MYDIFAVASEFGLSVDDIRTMLMDAKDDWDSCSHLTAGEYELIRRSINAPQLGSGAIAPVPDMPLQQQQQLVDNASQVLGFPLALSAMQEIRMVEALETAKNKVILGVVNAKRHELEETLAQMDSDRQAAFIDAVSQIAGMMPIQANGTQERMQAAAKSTNAQLDALLKSLGK